MSGKRASEYVGPQVKAFRQQRGWKQEDLVRRLEETVGPGWRQSKIAKIENGEAKRLTVDEVFELAAALGVSPLYLLAPDQAGDIAIGSKVTRPAKEIRQWVRGYLPLFLRELRELDPEQSEREQRFFYFESPPVNEWRVLRADAEFNEYLAELTDLTMSRARETR